MPHKVIVNQALKKKVIWAFATMGTKFIHQGDAGMTRNELRALERHGIVERMRTATRKWSDTTGTIEYVYRLKKGAI
jgi:L-rhamnose isomerase